MSARRLPGLVLLALVLAAGTFLPLFGTGEEPSPSSASSGEPGGRRGLFLLLTKLGFEPELWERPPGELPDPEGLLWLSQAPLAFDPGAAEDDPLERSRARGARAWSRYREFVEGGGALVLPASQASADFLTHGLGLDPAGTEPFGLPPDAFAGELAARAGGGGVRELHADELGLCAREIPVGEGAVVLVGDGAWLDNGELAGGGHALLAVRLVERYAGSPAAGAHVRPVRFDEWVFADRPRDGSALSLAFGPGRFATWHVLALLALAVWAALGVREFPRDPAPDEARSPLLRVSASAAFLARQGRYDALAEMLRSRTLEGPGGSPAGVTRTEPADLDGLVALDREQRSLEQPPTARRRARAHTKEAQE